MQNQPISKTGIEKEGLLSAFFFLCAVLILMFYKLGEELTYIGIIAGLTGIYFSFKNNFRIIAFIGIISAVSSFVGQSFTLFCSYCTLSACLFLAGGIIGLFKSYRQFPVYSLGLTIILFVSSVVFMVSLQPSDTREPVVYGEVSTIYREGSREAVEVNKNRLYISLSCPSCKKILPKIISKDPEGRNWEPVIVPHSSLYDGKQILKEIGYEGNTVLSASNPPVNLVPCMETEDGKVIKGKELREFIQNL